MNKVTGFLHIFHFKIPE